MTLAARIMGIFCEQAIRIQPRMQGTDIAIMEYFLPIFSMENPAANPEKVAPN